MRVILVGILNIPRAMNAKPRQVVKSVLPLTLMHKKPWIDA
jgi:hypothetical protein